MKRTLLTFILSLGIVISLPICVQAANYTPAAAEQAEPRSDFYTWYYKIEDGILYKRLYNNTKQCWIGEWEVCP